MEKALRLLRAGGSFSFNVSSSFLKTTYADQLRAFRTQNAAVIRIVDFGGLSLFAKAWNWLKKEYSPVACHLEPFADGARKRQDKGEFWWELRSCDYYNVLNGAKIV